MITEILKIKLQTKGTFYIVPIRFLDEQISHKDFDNGEGVFNTFSTAFAESGLTIVPTVYNINGYDYVAINLAGDGNDIKELFTFFESKGLTNPSVDIACQDVDFTAFTDSMYMIATHYEKGLLDKILIQQDVTMV